MNPPPAEGVLKIETFFGLSLYQVVPIGDPRLRGALTVDASAVRTNDHRSSDSDLLPADLADKYFLRHAFPLDLPRKSVSTIPDRESGDDPADEASRL